MFFGKLSAMAFAPLLEKMSVLIFVGGAALMAGCSTASDFKLTSSPEKAANATEALEACGEYRIAESAIDGKGGVVVAALKPWVTCLEVVLRKHKDLQESEGLLSLFRALLARQGDTTPGAMVGDARGVNGLVAATFDHQWRGGAAPCSDASQRVAVKDLPGYAQYLSATCPVSENRAAVAAPQSSPTVAHPEMGILAEDLKTAFSGPARGDKGQPPLKVKFVSADQKKFCEDYRDHIRRVSDLRDLLEYRDLLGAHSRSGEEKALKKRIEERIAELKKDELVKHDDLEKIYLTLNLGFPKSDCFFGDGVKKHSTQRKRARPRKKAPNA
jgi:hypothetical protein